MKEPRKKTEDIEMALDLCLQQLAAGKWSLGQCLDRYPQYAAELRPLLETALRLQQGKGVRAPGALRDRARAELGAHMQAHPRRKRKGRTLPNPATGVLILALMAVLTTTAFAQTARPGEALYPLKLSSERAWRLTAADPVAADLILSDRRADELIALAHETSLQHAPTPAQARALTDEHSAYSEVLDRLAGEATGPQGSRVLGKLQHQRQVLAEVGLDVAELDHVVSWAGKTQAPPPVHTP